MISGTHTIIYSDDAEADRAFFRDVLEVPHVDSGGGTLGVYQPLHQGPQAE